MSLEQALARACELLVSQQNPDLNVALALLGRPAGARRAHLWECRDGGRLWVNTHEWCAEGIKPLIDQRRHLDPTTVPWWRANLEAGKAIFVPDVEAVPPEALAERERVKEWGIEAMLTVPILSPKRELLGFTGFDGTDQSDHSRVADDAWVLRTFASMVVAYWTRAKAEQQAQLVSERFRLLTEQSGHPFLIVGADRILKYVGPAIKDALGYDPEESVGKSIELFIHPSDLPRLRKEFELCLGQPGCSRAAEGRVRHSDGSWRLVEARMVNHLHAPAVAGVVVHFRDVTELRRLERQVLRICTREREGLRRELHDALGGYFTAIRVRAEALAKKAPAGKTVKSGELSEIATLVEQARDTAHSISMAACPVPPGPEGLARALRQLASATQQIARRKVRFQCRSPVLVPDASAALQAYRVAQEAVNNAVRHSGATEIAIGLHEQEGTITLTVQDNGVGFDEAATSNSGMGISIMRYRARILHGSLGISKAPRGGTIVTLSFKPSSEGGNDGSTQQHRF